ncbi:hypothetical protein ACFL1G_11145 [Planctomycetota bacterium]
MKVLNSGLRAMSKASVVLLLVIVSTNGCKQDKEKYTSLKKKNATITISKELYAEGEIISPLMQNIEPIKKKYEGKIITGNTDKNYPRYAAAMEELLSEWSPVGHTSEEVQFVIGRPSDIRGDELIYGFEDGYSGRGWRLKLQEGKVVNIETISID